MLLQTLSHYCQRGSQGFQSTCNGQTPRIHPTANGNNVPTEVVLSEEQTCHLQMPPLPSDQHKEHYQIWIWTHLSKQLLWDEQGWKEMLCAVQKTKIWTKKEGRSHCVAGAQAWATTRKAMSSSIPNTRCSLGNLLQSSSLWSAHSVPVRTRGGSGWALVYKVMVSNLCPGNPALWFTHTEAKSAVFLNATHMPVIQLTTNNRAQLMLIKFVKHVIQVTSISATKTVCDC